ncbi:MAG: SDR family NAD(P)-dependent oxidoreductase [Dehalococcoidia bacterium]
MSISNFSLEGKVAVITGASRGIGRAIALGYAAAGAQLVMASRHLPDLEKAAEEVKERGKPPLIVPTDISRKADVDNLVRQTRDKFGAIDIMVNDPASFILGPILDIEEEDWDRVMNTNLKGFYFLCRASGLVMRERKRGSIINMTSTLGFRVSPRMPIYSVAKAGIIMLTKALAVELGPHNVRVNAIAPSIVNTEFSRTPEQDDSFRARRAQQIPMRRIAEPDDLVDTAIFLGSDASAFITGHTMVVDGGDLA